MEAWLSLPEILWGAAWAQGFYEVVLMTARIKSCCFNSFLSGSSEPHPIEIAFSL